MSMSFESILSHFQGLKVMSDGKAQALCPAHDDKKASLTISKNCNKTLLHCHAGCELAEVLTAAGLKESDLFFNDLLPPKPTRAATEPKGETVKKKTHSLEAIKGWPWTEAVYEYTDADGRPLFVVQRKAGKDFIAYSFNGNAYQSGLTDKRKVLFNLPAVAKALAEGELIFLVEGEKDCLNLAKHGMTATTSPFGAAGKWLPAYTNALTGAKVVILPDNDEPGRLHGAKALRALTGKAESVKVINLPGLAEHGDISDWLDAGGTADALMALVNAKEPATKATGAEGCLNEAEDWLKERYEFRRNMLLAGAAEWRVRADGPGAKWLTLPDDQVNDFLRLALADKIKTSEQAIRRSIYSSFSPLHDPIKAYFQGLDPYSETEGDLVKEVADCFSIDESENLTGVKNKAMFELYLRRWLIGATACGLDSEQHENFLILKGDQGEGKTRALRALWPPGLDEFCKEVQAINDQNAPTLLTQNFILLDSELESLNRIGMNYLKGILSQQTITYRKPYAREPITLPKRASLIGSVNQDSFLTDETGSRRFLIAPVKAVDYERLQAMKAEGRIDRLWAQVYWLYTVKKEKWYFDRFEISIINTANKAYSVTSIEGELLARTFEPGEPEIDEWLTSSEIAAKLQGDNRIDSRFIRNLGKSLRDNNFPRRTIRRGSMTTKAYAVRFKTVK